MDIPKTPESPRNCLGNEKFREGAGGSYTGEDVGGDELGAVSLNIQLWPDPPPCLCVGCFGRCISRLHCYFDFETVLNFHTQSKAYW